MVFRNTFATLALFRVVGSVRRMDRNTEVDEREWLNFDLGVGGVRDVGCGKSLVNEDMSVGHVEVPWRTTDSKVFGAVADTDCEVCGRDLEARGILESHWWCARKRDFLFSRAWFIERSAESGVREEAGKTHTFNLTEADAQGTPLPIPVGTSPLPQALRGIFWLSDQKASSALATFAGRTSIKEPADCTWCSKGDLKLNGYRIMPVGDCHWAFATMTDGKEIPGFGTLSGYGLARDLQVIYDFVFDHAEDPTSAHIRPIVNAIGSGWGEWLADQTWIADFSMTKKTSEEATQLGYTGSQVWKRQTDAVATLSPYDMVQIVDEDGSRIQPAWDAFVAYQHGEIAGTSPGILHYHGNC